MSGNELYDPDQAAIDTRWIQPWRVAFRAQRDVGLRVPINFHTVPAVSLTHACFSTNQYEHHAFQKCFSNLLGVGFRRFTVDAYWDQLRSVWSLCPVEQPRSDTEDNIVPIVSGPTLVVPTDTTDARVAEPTLVPPGEDPGFQRRQGSSQIASPSVAAALTSSSVSSPTSKSANPTIVSFPTTDGPPLLQIGSYNCTSLMTLDLLTGLLEDFLESTDTTTGASITLLTFNIHAAFSISNPAGPAPQLSQDQLPDSGNRLSDVLKGNLSSDTYTPSHLRKQRANLNDSWSKVESDVSPLQGYYEDATNANGQRFTESGWPTEAYMEFKQLFRLVTDFGTIDPQMQSYDIEADSDFVFPPGTLTKRVEASVGTSGQLSSGCLFAPSEKTVTSETNSSWAISLSPPIEVSASPDFMASIPSVSNLTSCGLTAFLNASLANTTADKNPLPYAAYVHSTLWTWAPGQPLNATSEGSNTTGNRCTVMTISPYPGRWHVADCEDRHRVACQDPLQPYNWEISAKVTNFGDAHAACHSPFEFSIPHTALENAYLLAALQTHRQHNPNDDAIFLDMNSLEVADCWVVGPNGTCPYLASTDTDRIRLVVVPTVAAVVIFVLAALTFFVKCAANRRENKRGRKRRMVGGWEYEGVPS